MYFISHSLTQCASYCYLGIHITDVYIRLDGDYATNAAHLTDVDTLGCTARYVLHARHYIKLDHRVDRSVRASRFSRLPFRPVVYFY